MFQKNLRKSRKSRTRRSGCNDCVNAVTTELFYPGIKCAFNKLRDAGEIPFVTFFDGLDIIPEESLMDVASLLQGLKDRLRGVIRDPTYPFTLEQEKMVRYFSCPINTLYYYSHITLCQKLTEISLLER
eukprot:sb/3475232/